MYNLAHGFMTVILISAVLELWLTHY